jgi:hypothetical protein
LNTHMLRSVKKK